MLRTCVCLIDVGLLFAPVDSAVSAALIVSASFSAVRFIVGSCSRLATLQASTAL